MRTSLLSTLLGTCCQLCHTVGSAHRNPTEGIYADALLVVQGIAAEASCDAGLLHMVLSLDAVRSLAAGSSNQQPTASATDSHTAAGDAVAGSVPNGAPAANAAAGGAKDGAAAETVRDSSGGIGGKITARPDGRVPLLCCGAADVDALQTHWERTPQPWRDSVAAGCR